MIEEDDDEAVKVEGALTLHKSEHMEDWYIIERAVHDHKQWMEKTEYGHALRCSSRISDGDVEGPAYEMNAIARAIMNKGYFSAKRCAVNVDKRTNTAEFWSPRNSRKRASVPLAVAEELAALILKEIPTLDVPA